MSKMITGSLNLSKILEAAKNKHSAFTKSEKSGEIFFNILLWENDEKDQYGNDFSVQLNPKKDAHETEKKKYIGNLKRTGNAEVSVQPQDVPLASDLPF